MPQNPRSRNETGDALLTVAEVAGLDRCSEKTVRRAIEAGLLQALRLGPGGRLLRVTRAAHEAYRRGWRRDLPRPSMSIHVNDLSACREDGSCVILAVFMLPYSRIGRPVRSCSPEAMDGRKRVSR